MPTHTPSPSSFGSPIDSAPGVGDSGRVRQPTSTSSARRAHVPVKRTRAGSVWVGIVVAVAVLVLLIVFMLQNTVPVEVAFLGLSGTAPLAVTLLIAGVGFAVVTLIVGSLRIGQLRHRIGSGPERDRHPTGDRH